MKFAGFPFAHRIAGGVAALGLSLCGASFAQTAGAAPITPERSKELFQAVTSQIDAGGDLFLYVELENALANLVGKVTEVVELLAKSDNDLADAPGVVRRVEAFLRTEGFHEGLGFGMSSRPLGGGDYLVKQFLARRPSTGAAPRAWRMMGGAPRELAVLNAVPSDAAILVSTDFVPADFWGFLQQAVRSIGGEEPWRQMREGITELKADTGADVDAMIESLSGEVAVAVLLSQDRTVRLPIAEGGVEVPSPSLLIVAGVRNTVISDWFHHMADEAPGGSEETIDGHRVRLGPVAGDAPVPLQPAFTQAGDLLLFASNADALRAALRAIKGDGRLTANPAYRRLMDQLPAANNGVTYADERFQQALMAIQKAQIHGVGGEVPALLMDRVFGWFPTGSSAAVRVIRPDGVLWQTVGPTGGKEMVMTAASAPLFLFAGVAMPAVVHARVQARDVSLVNQLRMVDGAKEQWALENNKSDGAVVTEADIAVYLRPGTVSLPPGHTLKLNPIGEEPEIVAPDGTSIRLP